MSGKKTLLSKNGGDVPTERNLGLDLLRGLSMVYIVGFWHLFNYVDLPQPHNALTWALIKIFLGTFFFLSAYLAGLTMKTDSWASVWQFYRRRFFRLYPLFLIAVLVFFFLDLAPGTTALRAALGVATLVGPPPLTLWFVCMLLLFLLLAPALAAAIDRLHWTASLTVLLVVYGAFTLYSYTTGLLDEQVLLYLPAFLVGLAAARKGWRTPAGMWRLLLPVAFVAAVAFAYLTTYDQPNDLTADPAIVEVPMVVLGAYCLFVTARALRFKRPFVRRSIYLLSYSAYCMYLFHRPIYMGLMDIWRPSTGSSQALYLYFIGLPVVVAASLIVQSGYDVAARKTRIVRDHEPG